MSTTGTEKRVRADTAIWEVHRLRQLGALFIWAPATWSVTLVVLACQIGAALRPPRGVGAFGWKAQAVDIAFGSPPWVIGGCLLLVIVGMYFRGKAELYAAHILKHWGDDDKALLHAPTRHVEIGDIRIVAKQAMSPGGVELRLEEASMPWNGRRMLLRSLGACVLVLIVSVYLVRGMPVLAGLLGFVSVAAVVMIFRTARGTVVRLWCDRERLNIERSQKMFFFSRGLPTLQVMRTVVREQLVVATQRQPGGKPDQTSSRLMLGETTLFSGFSKSQCGILEARTIRAVLITAFAARVEDTEPVSSTP
jgi:hypothetical protein